MTQDEFMNTDATVIKGMLRSGMMTMEQLDQHMEAWTAGYYEGNPSTGVAGARANRVRIKATS